MSFLNKLTDAAATFGDKASDTIEITKLKSRISSEKKAIELEMAKIGRIYYEKMKQDGFESDPDAAEIAVRIDAHYAAVDEIEKTLELYQTEKL